MNKNTFQQLSFSEYRDQIDAWSTLVKDNGIFGSNNEPLPTAFWKTFLGLKRTVHMGMYNQTHKIKNMLVPMYVCRLIHCMNEFSDRLFLELVKEAIPVFEKDTRS